MATIIRMRGPGGPEMLERAEIALGAPGADEIALRQEAIGVNFLDTYHRTGLYPLPEMPAVIGVEAAGLVTAIGPGVRGLAIGDRVAYAGAPVGAYASERIIAAWRALPLPEALGTDVAAAGLLKGLTAHMLMRRVHPVGPGTVVLIQGAAGGLGILLTRWAKRAGATIIGTVGSAAKAGLATAGGCDHVIVGRDADFAREVAALTKGIGVDFACDGIGGTTLLKTIACVRPFGTVASIGQAAGPIPAIAVEELGPRRSVSLARPSVMAYSADRATYRSAGAEVIALLAEGVGPEIGATYPLGEAARAHADIEAGRTTGSLVLIP